MDQSSKTTHFHLPGLFKTWQWPLSILGLVFLFYLPSISNTYADDAWRVTSDFERKNVQVEKGIAGIPEIFRSRYAEISNGSQLVAQYGYRPLPELTFAIEWTLWGQHPGRAHFINLLLYALLIYVLFLVFREIFPETGAVFLTIFAIGFLIHPIHSEVILALKNREAILAAIFGMLFILFAYRYAHTNRSGAFIPALLCLLLGMMSKDDIYMYMALVPGLWWMDWKGGRILERAKPFLLLVFLPLLGMMLLAATAKSMDIGNPTIRTMALLPIMGGIAWNANKKLKLEAHSDSRYASMALFSLGTALYFMGVVEFLLGEQVTQDIFWENPLFFSHSALESLEAGLKTIGFYCSRIFWPYPLSVYYGYDSLGLRMGWNAYLILGVTSVLSFIFLFLRTKRTDRLSRLAIYWTVIGLFLISNFLFPMTGMVAERYFFSVSIGVFLLLGAFSVKAISVLQHFDKLQQWLPNLRWVAICIIAGFWLIDFSRTMDWYSYETLYKKDARLNPLSAKMTSMYGQYLFRKIPENMAFPERLKQYEKILTVLEQSLNVYPSSADVLNLKGNILLEMDRAEEAIVIFEENIKANPDYMVSYNNLGTAYLQSGNAAEAMQPFRRAVQVDASAPEGYFGLCASYATLEKWDSARLTVQLIRERFGPNPQLILLDSLLQKQVNPFIAD